MSFGETDSFEGQYTSPMPTKRRPGDNQGTGSEFTLQQQRNLYEFMRVIGCVLKVPLALFPGVGNFIRPFHCSEFMKTGKYIRIGT